MTKDLAWKWTDFFTSIENQERFNVAVDGVGKEPGGFAPALFGIYRQGVGTLFMDREKKEQFPEKDWSVRGTNDNEMKLYPSHSLLLEGYFTSLYTSVAFKVKFSYWKAPRQLSVR